MSAQPARRAARAWGLCYRSVRHPGGECLAAFRPPAVTLPSLHKRYRCAWNGQQIHQG